MPEQGASGSSARSSRGFRHPKGLELTSKSFRKKSWPSKLSREDSKRDPPETKSYLGWSSLVPRCVAKPTDMSVLTQPRVGKKLKQDDSNRNETLTLKGTIRLASDWVSNHISWAVHKCSNIGQGYHLDGRLLTSKMNFWRHIFDSSKICQFISRQLQTVLRRHCIRSEYFWEYFYQYSKQYLLSIF